MSSRETHTLLINIEAKIDKAIKGMKEVSKHTKKSSQEMGVLRGAVKQASGMLINQMANAASVAVGEIFELGRQVETLRTSFDRLVEDTGASTLSLEAMQEATRGMVSDVDLLKSANQAMFLGLPTEGLEDMMFAAIKLGNALGIDAKMAVESLTTGIGRQSKLILDNLGVVFDAADAYEWYADKIGVASSELDENQKKLGWQEFAMEQVSDKAASLGENLGDATIKNAQFETTMTNLKTTVGELLSPLAGIAPILEGLMPTLATVGVQLIPQITMAIKGAGGLSAAVTGLGTALKVNLLPALAAMAGVLQTLIAVAFPLLLLFGIATADFTDEEVEKIQRLEEALSGGFDRMNVDIDKFRLNLETLPDIPNVPTVDNQPFRTTGEPAVGGRGGGGTAFPSNLLGEDVADILGTLGGLGRGGGDVSVDINVQTGDLHESADVNALADEIGERTREELRSLGLVIG